MDFGLTGAFDLTLALGLAVTLALALALDFGFGFAFALVPGLVFGLALWVGVATRVVLVVATAKVDGALKKVR